MVPIEAAELLLFADSVTTTCSPVQPGHEAAQEQAEGTQVKALGHSWASVMPNTSVSISSAHTGRIEVKVSEDAEICEVGGQEVKGAPAVSGASEPWSELVKALDIRPWLSRLQFGVKIQWWHVGQETVLKVSLRDWANMTGWAWRPLNLAGLEGSSFTNLCIKPQALVAGV